MYATAAVFAIPAAAVAFVPLWTAVGSFVVAMGLLLSFLVRRPRSKKFVPVGELSLALHT